MTVWLANRGAIAVTLIALAFAGCGDSSPPADLGIDVAPLDGSDPDGSNADGSGADGSGADGSGADGSADTATPDSATDSANPDAGADLAAIDLAAVDTVSPDAPVDTTVDTSVDVGPDISVDAPAIVNPLTGMGTVDVVQAGFTFIEGPLWRPNDGVLLFTDLGTKLIHRLTPPNTIDIFRMNSGGANGLGTDTQGRLLACEGDNQLISRTEANGTIVTFISMYQGQQLNSPNDITVRSDGTVYFSDPRFVTLPPLGYHGVYRVQNGVATLEWQGAQNDRPNGIVLSPDEKTLYLASTDMALVRAFDVAANGALSNERVFTSVSPTTDGLAVDVHGNLYVATQVGVEVFSPAGTKWGTIPTPTFATNVGFGDANFQTLYITGRTALYRVALQVQGQPK